VQRPQSDFVLNYPPAPIPSNYRIGVSDVATKIYQSHVSIPTVMKTQPSLGGARQVGRPPQGRGCMPNHLRMFFRYFPEAKRGIAVTCSIFRKPPSGTSTAGSERPADRFLGRWLHFPQALTLRTDAHTSSLAPDCGNIIPLGIEASSK
jgi:hypothetical protein